MYAIRAPGVIACKHTKVPPFFSLDSFLGKKVPPLSQPPCFPKARTYLPEAERFFPSRVLLYVLTDLGASTGIPKRNERRLGRRSVPGVSTMSKIVVLSLGFRGHINPLLPIVETLVTQGHQVTHFCIEAYGKEIAQTGATFKPYASMFEPNFEFPSNNATFSYFLATVLEARKVLPQVLPSLRGKQPDLVLYDGACLSGRLLGEILQCPTAKLCPSYASTEDYSPFAQGRQQFFENSEKVAAFDAEVQKLNQEFGVQYDLRGNIGHAEKLNIVCMPRTFHPNESVFDERFAFIGPSLRGVPSVDSNETSSPHPSVYISLGTLNNNKPDFFRKCLQAFGSSPLSLKMSVGHRVDSSDWDIPENFMVRPFFPQLEVLTQTQCSVSQGGMNSVQEALYFGVPLVVLPSTGEQTLTANRIQELGLGIGLEIEDPPISELKEHVEAVLSDPGYSQRAKEFSVLSRNSGGPPEAARRIESFLGI